MSEIKGGKRKHTNDIKHKKSKKSKKIKSSNDKNKIENPSVEEEKIDFEIEKERRREYVKNIMQKRDGLTNDDRSFNCPYLDTINRNVLDFDFEKTCVISQTQLNVYACLVCGKYYQGRGANTHAHTHSVDQNHHVFLNLETHRFYCLPDNYQIINNSLDDIVYLLNPTFTEDQIKFLDKDPSLFMAYNGNTYYPGIVGVNNIKANDYCNVIIQMLSHIAPIRDYFLRVEEKTLSFASGDLNSRLVLRFGELIRKLWNQKNFKTHVSPHEFLQAVVLCSKKRFQFIVQSKALEFFAFLNHAMHGSMKVKNSSVFSKAFRGKMKIYSRKVIPVALSDEDKRQWAQLDDFKETMTEETFFYLTCDFPPPPLYKDEMHSTVIPQVPLTTLLSKFNGESSKEYKTYKESYMKTFVLQKLPPYLTLHFKRFVENYMRKEKIPTIVSFTVASFDFAELLLPEYRKRHKYTTYDLIGNVVHEGTIDGGCYKAHIKHEATGKWYCMQDLHVDEVISEMIPLGESVMQIWKINKSLVNPYYEGP